MHVTIDIAHLRAYILLEAKGLHFLKSTNIYVGMTTVVPRLAAPFVFARHSGGGSYFPCPKLRVHKFKAQWESADRSSFN